MITTALILMLALNLLLSYYGTKSDKTSKYIKCIIIVLIASLLMSIKYIVDNDLPDMNRTIQRVNSRKEY